MNEFIVPTFTKQIQCITDVIEYFVSNHIVVLQKNKNVYLFIYL